MYLCKETMAMLSDIALVLNGREASFKVYNWGIVSPLFDNPVHKHSFFEVCYVMDGEGEYTDDGIHYLLKPGTHFISRPGVTHQIRTANGLFLLYVGFELDHAQSSETMRESFQHLAEHAVVVVEEAAQHPTALLWKSLLLQEKPASNLPQAAIPSISYSLLLSFLTLFGGRVNRTSQPRQHSNHYLQQAKLFIRDNLSQPLSLQLVANYLNVSERHLSRLFASGIHENFTQFVRDERIRQGSHLLMNSELSIKEIAEATGFSSVHYFSRLFMEVIGLPPAKFRKQHQTSQA
ncbi:AraC family transcriptional regulator [Paenibacillus roseipurpureus]|uniref:AraC family transcriptional regulator n=1 Tax=Paenibacillus roseopurpureus TaxID=2918901 RepID=A0AA96RP19_9BACL|nr:AraC family transcriptional regulator [Paenibacillus sp. MBLB1832]WNR46192.1 AraC family transcriptional regulator [Paenibacillus sp. MBLB1832]